MRKRVLMSYANNKGADQPAHPCSLISAFVVHCLDNVMSLVSVTKISSLMLVSVAEQVSLSLTWLETPEDRFSHDEAQIFAVYCMITQSLPLSTGDNVSYTVIWLTGMMSFLKWREGIRPTLKPSEEWFRCDVLVAEFFVILMSVLAIYSLKILWILYHITWIFFKNLFKKS